jgi:hypothetical protein
MADEGIDAIADSSVIFQVKWSTKLLPNPVAWLTEAIRGERHNIVRLVREKRISRYILMTSVAGTTTNRGNGSIQKLQEQLDEYSNEFGVPVECWWQSDIDAEVDAAPDSLKWTYQEMLAGADAMRYLIHGAQVEGRAAGMRDTVLQVMASQWREDAKIKFSQVDMDRVSVAEMFVDVKAAVLHPQQRNGPFSGGGRHETVGALAFMLGTDHPSEPSHRLIFLIGVPGQGKSTLGQYLSQMHRAAILPNGMLGGRRLPAMKVADPKLPLRIDLTDYASWLSGQDPFGEDDQPKPPSPRTRGERSLELFIADFCSAYSGGRQVSVEDVQSLLARYPVLLVLDGLDEVPDPDLRSVVVEEINFAVARMEASSGSRRFQILVTARPNASGLAEPDRDLFQTLWLEPLTSALQSEYIDKWCDVNDIHGRARRDIRKTFLSRTAVDQVAQLADNPMQLTILLFLINRKGDAVPTSLTPLYSDYMTTLLDREVTRKQIQREQIPRIHEITAFLGWHMHAGVEAEPAAGRMTRKDIETTLVLYFRATGGPEHEAGKLLKAATDRFWALTSKVEGTFEFAVQPVREYFAAKFLAEWAGRDRRDPLPKEEVLRSLIGRAYWLNVARFYAGFASPNELAGLRYGLEEAIAGNRHPLQERAAAWTLLSDGNFANSLRVQRDVARLLTDDLSVQLIAGQSDTSANFPGLPPMSGGREIGAALMDDLRTDPASPLAPARASILRDRASLDKSVLNTWWTAQFNAAIGTASESAWLNLGSVIGAPRLQHDDVNRLTLDTAARCRAALRAGVSPDSGTDEDRQLLRAVLTGLCSDVTTSSSSEAGMLLRTMRPQWYLQLQEENRGGPNVATGHLWLAEADRGARPAYWSQLLELNPQYEALSEAANPPGKRQEVTIEPWQNPAQELARLHGPCWLAAEIAIAGAASYATVGSSVGRDGEPFGEKTDYGVFVLKVHRHPSARWWEDMHDQYIDPLSRRTWSLALLATAATAVVISQLGRIDACLTSLTDEEFLATAASSSRLGVLQPHRRLPAQIWNACSALSRRTRLLIAHFTAGLSLHDPLSPLSDTELVALASPDASAWPIARAVTTRLLSQPSPTLLEALAALGPRSVVDLPRPKSAPGVRMADAVPGVALQAAILGAPAHYPGSWTAAVEREHSLANEETSMEREALAKEWVPKVPRLLASGNPGLAFVVSSLIYWRARTTIVTGLVTAYPPVTTARKATVPGWFSVTVNVYDSFQRFVRRRRCAVPNHWYRPCESCSCSRVEAVRAPLSSSSETVSRNPCRASTIRGPDSWVSDFAKAGVAAPSTAAAVTAAAPAATSPVPSFARISSPVHVV